jgi:hypothetical protein
VKKNNCGRPGINGGYIYNPNLRMGVNCYGVKPAATHENVKYFNALRNQPEPQSPVDLATQAKMQFWKENADKLGMLNGFNRSNWSEF